MWTLGIRDKKLLSIVSSMLKAEVAGIGFPEKGTPQGGNILTDDDQIFVFVCATEIPGQFAVAVDVANLQQFSSHSAFAEKVSRPV